MRAKSLLFIIAILFAPVQVQAETARNEMEAVIIIPESMNKSELLWFCVNEQHVPACKNLKTEIKARRHARKNRQKDWQSADKKDKQQVFKEREEKIRQFLKKTGY